MVRIQDNLRQGHVIKEKSKMRDSGWLVVVSTDFQFHFAVIKNIWAVLRLTLECD